MNERRIEIESNLSDVENRIKSAAESAGRGRDEITLVAVTKYFPVSDALILYENGVRNFGENRDDEGRQKSNQLPADAIWHFQGQIQGRKIPSIISWADQIHSLDSLDHALKFNRILQAAGESRRFMIQLSLEPSREDRGGIALNDLPKFLDSLIPLTQLEIRGVMAVLPIEIEPSAGFAEIVSYVKALNHSHLQEYSLGMSNDFEDAIRAGATHIRVGSSILGSRPTLA